MLGGKLRAPWLRVWGLGFRVECRVLGGEVGAPWLRVEGLVFGVQDEGLGFSVWGSK